MKYLRIRPGAQVQRTEHRESNRRFHSALLPRLEGSARNDSIEYPIGISQNADQLLFGYFPQESGSEPLRRNVELALLGLVDSQKRNPDSSRHSAGCESDGTCPSCSALHLRYAMLAIEPRDNGASNHRLLVRSAAGYHGARGSIVCCVTSGRESAEYRRV